MIPKKNTKLVMEEQTTSNEVMRKMRSLSIPEHLDEYENEVRAVRERLMSGIVLRSGSAVISMVRSDAGISIEREEASCDYILLCYWHVADATRCHFASLVSLTNVAFV